MSRPMTFQEFADVVNFVKNNNNPFVTRRAGMPVVKYMYPAFGMRTNVVFSITFRGFFGSEVVFHCQNECRDLPESLYGRCMAYLKGQ